MSQGALPLPLVGGNPWVSRLSANLLAPVTSLPTTFQTPGTSAAMLAPSANYQNSDTTQRYAKKGFSIADILSEPEDQRRPSDQKRLPSYHTSTCSNMPPSRDNNLLSLSHYFASAAVQQCPTGMPLPHPLTVPMLPPAVVSHHLQTTVSPSATGTAPLCFNYC